MCVAQREDGAVCAEMLLKDPQWVVLRGSGKPSFVEGLQFLILFFTRRNQRLFEKMKEAERT